MVERQYCSACLPGVEHKYYGISHFSQTKEFTHLTLPSSSALKLESPKKPTTPSSSHIEETPQQALISAISHNDVEKVDSVLSIEKSLANKPLNAFGLLPLHLASTRGYILVVKALIEKGDAKVDAVDKEHESAIFKAAYHGQIDVVRYLILKGADCNLCDSYNWSALSNSASRGFMDCVELLLTNNANVNEQSTSGYTALMNAASKGYSAIVQTLLKHNANPLLKNSFKDCAYDLACQSEESFICDMIEDAEKEALKQNPGSFAHSTVLEVVFEYQANSLLSSKFSPANLPERELAWVNKYGQPKTMNQVHLPNHEWFWLTDWKIDLKYPGVDDQGWELLPSPKGIWPQTHSKRRRRWIRVRKLRFDVIPEDPRPDYFQKAQNLFSKCFPEGNLLNVPETSVMFEKCQTIIEILMDGIKSDVDLKRKQQATIMVGNLLTKAESLKSELEGTPNSPELDPDAEKELEGDDEANVYLNKAVDYHAEPSDSEVSEIADEKPRAAPYPPSFDGPAESDSDAVSDSLDDVSSSEENMNEIHVEDANSEYSSDGGDSVPSVCTETSALIVFESTTPPPPENGTLDFTGSPNSQVVASSSGQEHTVSLQPRSPSAANPETATNIEPPIIPPRSTSSPTRANIPPRLTSSSIRANIPQVNTDVPALVIPPRVSSVTAPRSTTFLFGNLAERPSGWQPDEEAPDCCSCHVSFTFFNRRHHCRFCLLIFCDKCSSKKSFINGRLQRVCDSCYEELFNAPQSAPPDTEDGPLSRSIISECPVCFASLDPNETEAHLQACLSNTHAVQGNRYVRTRGGKTEGECAICFEEFNDGREEALMNCFCVYHEQCLKEWFESQRARGVSYSCPVHYK